MRQFATIYRQEEMGRGNDVPRKIKIQKFKLHKISAMRS